MSIDSASCCYDDAIITTFVEKKLKMEKPSHIGEVLDAFSQGVESCIGNIAQKFKDKIVMGYRSQSYHSHKQILERYLEDLNELVEIYKELFADPTHPSDILNSILDAVGTEKIESKVRGMYLDSRQVKVPGVPIKREKLIEVYDYPEEDENSIKNLVEKLEKISGYKKGYNWTEHLNEQTGKLELSAIQDSKLLEQYTVYATIEELSEIVSLHLLCAGLTNLKAKDYTFKDLPEIDHRILQKIKIDKDRLGIRELGLSVDIDKMNNPNLRRNTISIHSTANTADSYMYVTQTPKPFVVIRLLKRKD